MAGYIFSAEIVDQYRRNPIHEVIRDLGRAARDANLIASKEFRKLLGYLTDFADGRDRREPMVDVPGSHRPQPRLRVLINAAFGEMGDLVWFRLNKVANASHMPLVGAFSRMAAGIGRIDPDQLDEFIRALVSDSPDRMLLRLLNQNGGRIKGTGFELYTRIAYLFRPDLYFLVPRLWGEDSGCIKFVGDDMRKYGALCRTLRDICDEVGFPSEVRGTLFSKAVEMEPMHPKLEGAINASIGGALAWVNTLEPNEGYVPGHGRDEITMPLEIAPAAIRVRRGETKLRSQLARLYQHKCAVSGDCPKDLLEVAYIAPFPAGDVNSVRNAVLLRSDLHTLWDCNLIAAHPDSLEIAISDRLAGSYIEQFAGCKLAERSEAVRLDTTALRERWRNFEEQQRSTRQSMVETKPGGSAGTALREVEIEVLNDLEPKRAPATGIWRSSKRDAAENPAAAAPVIDLVDE